MYKAPPRQKCSKQSVEAVCDYVRVRTEEYGLWVNDLGEFGISVPQIQVISENFLRCMLRGDIKASNVSNLSGKMLDTVITHALAAIRKIYLLKHQNIALDQNPT